MRTAIAWALLALVGLASGACVPVMQAGGLMPGGGPVPGPLGWYRYCGETDDEGCPVLLTPDRRAELERVNHVVNRDTRYRTDSLGFAAPDRWFPADGEGDCEDYALAKLRRLVEHGWPRRALRLALATTDAGEPHVVLTVDTDWGTLVLDNLRARVVPWEVLPYRWHKREVPGAFDWQAVEL